MLEEVSNHVEKDYPRLSDELPAKGYKAIKRLQTYYVSQDDVLRWKAPTTPGRGWIEVNGSSLDGDEINREGKREVKAGDRVTICLMEVGRTEGV